MTRTETDDNDDKADFYVPFSVSDERWNVEEVRDHVYVITDKDGDGREMRVTGADTLAHPKPDYDPDDHEGNAGDDTCVVS